MSTSIVSTKSTAVSQQKGAIVTKSHNMSSAGIDNVKTGNPNEPSGGYRLPDQLTMSYALRLSVVEDKPIMMDYWVSSLEKTVLIGVKENQEKLLVKDAEQYTSPVSKIYKVATEYIIMTENSIYIVDVNIPTKRISA